MRCFYFFLYCGRVVSWGSISLGLRRRWRAFPFRCFYFREGGRVGLRGRRGVDYGFVWEAGGEPGLGCGRRWESLEVGFTLLYFTFGWVAVDPL